MSSQIPPRPTPDASGACPEGWVRGAVSGNCVPARVGTNLNTSLTPPETPAGPPSGATLRPQVPVNEPMRGSTPYSGMVAGAVDVAGDALRWFGEQAAAELGFRDGAAPRPAAPPAPPPGARTQTKADADRMTIAAGTANAAVKNAAATDPAAGKAPPTPTSGTRPASTPTTSEPRGDYYDRVKFVKLPNGRIVAVDSERAGALTSSGAAEWMTHEDAVTALAKKRAAGDPGREGAQGADIVVGESASFTRPGSTAVPGHAIGTMPYSERLRGLLAEPSGIDLSAPATESGSLSQPGGKTRTLSGLEQAVERRNWLEGRVEAERARELRDEDIELRRAMMRQRLEAAQLDPTALAQIEASGKYGGEWIKSESAAQMRQMALMIYQSFMPKIAEARLQMSRASTDAERAALQSHIDDLQRAARDQANLAIGAYLRDPKFDMMSMLLAGALTGAPGASSGGGAGT